MATVPACNTKPEDRGFRHRKDWFDIGLFGCCAAADCGLFCCLQQSCICSQAYAHCIAMGWVNAELGARAERVWTTELLATGLSVAAGAGGDPGRRNPFGDLLATAFELQADFQGLSLRRTFIQYMYGMWVKSTDGSVLQFVPTRTENPFVACCAQFCFAPCARCQEVDAAMRWRQSVQQRRVRFGNPCLCKWGFEEEIAPNYWFYPAQPMPFCQQIDPRLPGGQQRLLDPARTPAYFVAAPPPSVTMLRAP